MERRNGWGEEPFNPFIEEIGQPNSGEPDESSEENVRYSLEALEVEVDAELELEAYHTLEMAQRSSENLKRFGLADELDVEKYRELCESLEVVPETEEGMFAVEDIFFNIQQKDYDYRDLSDHITVEDMISEAEEMDYEKYIDLSIKAVGGLRKIIKDPILDYRLKAFRMEQLKKKNPETMDEYDELQAEMTQLERELNSIEDARGIPQINTRRDRAIRRMYWLLRQDFALPILKEFKKRMDSGDPLTFAEAAEKLAVTRGVDTKALQLATIQWEQKLAAVPAKKQELLEMFESGRITQKEKEEAERQLDNISEPTVPYLSSMADELMNLEREVDNREGFSRKKERRAALLDKRLQQTKEVCEVVFAPDLRDRIYERILISEQELERVETMHNIMHKRGDISHLERFFSLMPGGAEALEEDEEVNLKEAIEYGGKTKLQLMEDIGDIVYELIEENELERLQQLKQNEQITPEQSVELGEIAIQTLKTLVFRHNIPVSRLLS